ncbi:ABC transporter permease [Actinomadura barringtoniae]|uniref:ABC transporter permease n=1 Tax=Actinomadura barringtoniae TaxID=1427535 RepID=A0A939PNB1_9ACTN|nr:ABC transporter permease [Actinomadura barringtoniae]MBO2455477.1 ABC transporter permease [Actinomadura barringtoniae]
MSTMTLPSLRMTGHGFRTLLRTQARLTMRDVPVVAAGIGLPILLLIIFGSIPSFTEKHADLGGRTTLDAFVPTLAMMSAMVLACTGLPTFIAELRERGALRRLSASPVPAAGVLAAQLIVIVAIAAVVGAVVIAIATLGFGAEAPQHPGTTVAAALLGSTAVLGLGLLIAGIAGNAGAASGMGIPVLIANFFAGGLYAPVEKMPHILQDIVGFLPFGAVVETWSGIGATWLHLTVLAVYTVLASLLAVRFFRWE